MKPVSVFADVDYNFAQNDTALNEVSTPSYLIVNAGATIHLRNPKSAYSISLSVNNIFNKAYYDHLSRFKYYDLLNMGRNITLSMKLSLKTDLRKSGS